MSRRFRFATPLCLIWFTCIAAVAGLGLTAGCSGTPEDRLVEIRAMQEAGEFRASIEPLREILARVPGHAEANLRLGVALARSGQTNLAVWPLERAAASAEQALDANLALASLYFELRDYESAIASAGRVLELRPDEPSALSLRYKAELEAKRHARALEDIDRLLVLAPENPEMVVARAVVLGEMGRLDEAALAYQRVIEVADAAGEPEFQARACVLLALHYRDDVKATERAEATLLDCLARFPESPFVVQKVLDLYDETDRGEQALALARRHFEAAPEDLGRRGALARRLQREGRTEDAEALLLEAVEATGGLPERLALAEFYRTAGEPAKALAIADEVVDEQGELRGAKANFLFAEMLMDAGEIERAQPVIARIEEPLYEQLASGRMRLLQGDAAGALELLDTAVAQWPDNGGARYLAGLAALRTGEVERAVGHLREAVRIDAGATDASLLLAQLYLERGEAAEAARFAGSFVKRRAADRPEGYQVRIQALVAQEKLDDAREALAELEDAGFAAQASVEGARIETAAGGPEAAVRFLESRPLEPGTPEAEAALRALMDALFELGRGEQALRRVRDALAARPEDPALLELSGRARARLDDRAGARADFEAALARAPEHAGALAGLATLTALDGDREAAIALFDRSAAADPRDGSAAYSAAQLVLQAGRREEGERRLRELVRAHSGHAGSRNDLAWLLAEAGRDLDRALALAREASRIDPSPPVLDTLGFVHLARGEPQAAVAALEQALEKQPDDPSIRYRLGRALALAGDNAGAGEAFRRALGAGSFPEAEAARAELDRLEARPE